MRDHRGLEEITDAVSRGLLVGDVIVALDKSLSGGELDDDEQNALTAGSHLLREMAHPEEAAAASSSTGSLMATDAAIDAVARAHGQPPPDDIRKFLETLSDAVRAAAEGSDVQKKQLETVMELFSFLGDVELARANDLSRERQDPGQWLGTLTASLSS